MRRKRYTVWFPDDPTPSVILAYSAFDAEVWYRERKGRTVARVTEGDYRSLPASTGARLDTAAIQEAADDLGLTLPLDVKVSGRATYRVGLHRAQPSHPQLTHRGKKICGAALVLANDACWTHVITISTKQHAKQMGETVWHELAHAWQFEQYIMPFREHETVFDVIARWRSLYFDGVSYSEKQLEQEADALMARNDSYPLAHA